MKFLTVALTLSLGLLTSISSAEDAYTVVDKAGKHLDVVTPTEKTVLRYVYVRDRSTKATTFDTAKVFAHVFADDGKTTLTKGPGGKFPHHRGIFIGWSKLKQGGKSHDLWHVRNTEQLHKSFMSTEADNKGATITAQIDWIGVDGDVVIIEQRTYQVVDSNDAHAVIDFTSEMKAVNGEVELNGDPEHAGIQFRPSQKVADNKSAKYLFHEEGVDPTKQKDLPWVAESFKIDDAWWTVQHMSHPENPKGARWSAYRDYGRFGPFTVVKIDDGESVTFRYRFVVLKGNEASRDGLTKKYSQYSSGRN